MQGARMHGARMHGAHFIFALPLGRAPAVPDETMPGEALAADGTHHV